MNLLDIQKPGDLFPNDLSKCKAKYKELAKKYHPDSGGDLKAFEHLTSLYEKALSLIREGKWEKTNYIEMKTEKGTTLKLSYQTFFPFELGVCYICRKHVIYVLFADKEKYWKNAKERITGLKYADKKMKEEMSRFVPEIQSSGKLADGQYYLVFKKGENVYPLRCVRDAFKEIPDRHVAWIISRLSGLCCFLSYNDLVHNGIDINSCFICPEYHSIVLLGGWWYCVKEKERLLGTTKEIFDLMPVVEKTEKRAAFGTDLESVKQIGRQLFGSETSRELFAKKIPKSFQDFLISGSSEDSFQEMEKWDQALLNSYGVRKFIKWNVTEKEIYGKTR